MSELTPQDKAFEARVHELFQSIAGRYNSSNDRISLGLHRRWKRCLNAELCAHTPPQGSVLDVCCGTGDVSLRLAAARPDAQVCGLDFSSQMLAVAQAKPGSERVRWLLDDAMNLPFANDSLDAVVTSFGLRNLPNRERAVAEMVRVLRPGGYFYCLESSVPDAPLVRWGHSLYFYHLMPLLGGGLRQRKQYKWLSRTTRTFMTKQQLKALLEASGLTEVTWRSFLLGSSALHIGKKRTDI